MFEALRRADGNDDGVIKLSQLVAYVQEREPMLAKVLAEKAIEPQLANDLAKQTARFGAVAM